MKSLFVHVIDQIQYEPEIAQLAALMTLRAGEGSARVLMADYGTDDAAFLRAFAAASPRLLFLRLTAQSEPVLRHAWSRLRELPDRPLAVLHGPLCADAPDAAAATLLGSPGVILGAESEAAAVGLLDALEAGRDPVSAPPPGCIGVIDGVPNPGASLPPVPADAVPNPHFGVFGGGALFDRGIGCSFFGEVGAFPLEVAVGTPSGAPANAALAPFSRHVPGTPRLRGEALLRDRLRHARHDFSNIRHVEVRDRELGFDAEGARRIAAVMTEDHPDLPWTVRLLPDTAALDLLPELVGAGATRLVVEYDAADEAVRAAIDGQNPHRVEAAVRAARDAGMETGVLVSVGLPGETPEAIATKLAELRAWGVDRVRFFPFEPRFGHPVHALCRERGLLDDDEDAWNREVYRPLRQACMPVESWYLAWQDCLALQAELAAGARTGAT